MPHRAPADPRPDPADSWRRDLTRAEFVALLERLARAIHANDHEAAADCFSEGVSYVDPLRYAFHSREEVREFYRLPSDKTQRVAWHTLLFDEAEQAGVAEYTYEEAHRYHGLVLIRVAGGKVTRWREYQHISDLEREAFVRGPEEAPT